LRRDLEAVERFNARHAPPRNINVNSIPEPLIGSPDSAVVALLGLNPGDDDGDRQAHGNPEFREAMIRNLCREQQAYPFYPLNPRFERTPTARWWRPRLRWLNDAGVVWETIARGVLVIE